MTFASCVEKFSKIANTPKKVAKSKTRNQMSKINSALKYSVALVTYNVD